MNLLEIVPKGGIGEQEWASPLKVKFSPHSEPGSESQTPKGGLWIAHAESKAALETLLKTDPFYTAGLRQSYEILHWSKANEARMELI